MDHIRTTADATSACHLRQPAFQCLAQRVLPFEDIAEQPSLRVEEPGPSQAATRPQGPGQDPWKIHCKCTQSLLNLLTFSIYSADVFNNSRAATSCRVLGTVPDRLPPPATNRGKGRRFTPSRDVIFDEGVGPHASNTASSNTTTRQAAPLSSPTTTPQAAPPFRNQLPPRPTFRATTTTRATPPHSTSRNHCRLLNTPARRASTCKPSPKPKAQIATKPSCPSPNHFLIFTSTSLTRHWQHASFHHNRRALHVRP